ncbi:hypothetical protein ACS0TY_002524 [Phlomoides rotata]
MIRIFISLRVCVGLSRGLGTSTLCLPCFGLSLNQLDFSAIGLDRIFPELFLCDCSTLLTLTSVTEIFHADGNTSNSVFVENEADLMDAGLEATKNLPSTETESKCTDSSESLEKDHCLSVEGVKPQSSGNLPSADNSPDPQSKALETSASKSDTGVAVILDLVVT